MKYRYVLSVRGEVLDEGVVEANSVTEAKLLAQKQVLKKKDVVQELNNRPSLWETSLIDLIHVNEMNHSSD